MTGIGFVPDEFLRIITPFFIRRGFLTEHDHTGDDYDGGQLEADEVLLATDIIEGFRMTADGLNATEWTEVWEFVVDNYGDTLVDEDGNVIYSGREV